MNDTIKIAALEPSHPFERDQLPLQWDAEHVGKRLVKAFVTLDRLPKARGPRKPGGHWPGHTVEWVDQLAQAELTESERREREQTRNRALIRPSGVEISQMEAAFDWLLELHANDSGMALVTSYWALRCARGRSIKKLCAEKKWAPHTFYRKRSKALTFVATWLNDAAVPVF
jgi:hypothetical protein